MNRVAGLLLAAGRGTRFGGDKLQADLGGHPVAHHAARTMASLGLWRLFAVVAGEGVAPGFQPVLNPDVRAGQGRSLALGVAAAQDAGAEAVLVMLADMPLVSVEHAKQILAGWNGPATLVASGVGRHRCPPALFGCAWFDALRALDGDQGARSLLGQAELVPANADELMDVDLAADLITARDRLKR